MKLTSLNSFNEQSGNLSRVSQKVNRSLRALASGEYITHAVDDVARLSISTKLFSRITSLRSAAINVAQADSLLQVADGGLADITDLLLRMQSLSVMAAAGTLSASERGFLNQEFQALGQEIDRIASQTNFNGVRVLNGAGEGEAVDTPLTLTGTDSPERLEGGSGEDTIQGMAGDDTIKAAGEDDIIESGQNILPGLLGSIFASGAGIGNLAQAEAVVAAALAPGATFTSQALDYPQGALNSQASTVGNFLGADSASISNAAMLGQPAQQMVFVFDGFLQVDVDGVYNFSVGSDDGFDLQIDGASVLQFPNIRGFGITSGNVPLTAGTHSIRFLYWENAGSEGMEVVSSLTGGGILDNTVLTHASAPTDGNDSIDGGTGIDVATFDGNAADYTIDQLNETTFRITDNRTGLTNGVDTLENVEIARFADEDVTLIDPETAALDEPRTLRFMVSENSSDQLNYVVVDATLSSLFDAPETLNIATADTAREAQGAVREALNRTTFHRAYVGSLQSQAGFIAGTVFTRIQNQDAARAVMQDTDIAAISTELVSDLVKRNAVVAVSAQTDAIREESILNMLRGVALETQA